MMSEIAIANVGADGDFIARDKDLSEWEATDIDEMGGGEDVEFHEVDESGAAGEEGRLCVGGNGLDGSFGSGGGDEGKRVHLAVLLNVLDGCYDIGISAAAADVATHVFANFGGRERLAGGFGEQSYGRHDLARGAVTALKTIEFEKGLLHGMESAIVRKAFDGDDFIVLVGDGERQAGESAAAIDVNRACAALALVAALFRAVKAEMLTKGVEQGGAGIEMEGMLGAVDS